MSGYHCSLLVLSLLGSACATQGRSTAPILSHADPAEPAPSAYAFPERAALSESLQTRPAPAPVFAAEAAAEAPWTIDGELPVLPQAAPHETETHAGQLLTEIAAERTELTATDGGACLARAVARHLAEHGSLPTETRRTFLATRCGVASPAIDMHGRGWENVPTRMPEARVWAQVQGQVRQWLSETLPSTRANVGVHLARHEQTASIVLVLERPRAQLQAVRPMPDESGRVIVRGRLLSPAAMVDAYINHGAVGVRRCRSLPGLALPDFALSCPMAPEDSVAGIDVMAYPPNRALGEPAAQLLARRSEEAARTYQPPDVGEPAAITEAAAFAPALLERVNTLRTAHGMKPLRLAETQGAALAPAMPHFFDPTRGGEVQDLIALTMLAGWEVGGAAGGTIADATLSAHASYTTDVAQWLARCLDSPMMRATLMQPDDDVLAVAPVVEAGGIAAMVASFQLYDPARTPFAAAATVVIQRITDERAARGLAPPTIIETGEAALQAEVDRARSAGKAPNQVLDAALSRASREWGRDVRGMVGHIGGDPSSFEVPAEFLRPGPLYLQAASTFHQAPGAPWGQWLVVLLTSA